jgi:hypothetical protein
MNSMNEVLNIIFTMLMSLNNCNFTDSIHIMMLPQNVLYHTYEYKGDIILTPHEDYKSFSDSTVILHMYSGLYPKLITPDNIQHSYCYKHHEWEMLYRTNSRII